MRGGVDMEYAVDEAHAEVVLGKIWQRYESGLYPYDKHESQLPQYYIPESLPRGGAEEAWYWLVVCLWMRGGVNSTDSARALTKLYDSLRGKRSLNPFDPHQAARISPARIVKHLESVGLGMHQVAPDWIENARRLTERWDGSVLKLFSGVRNYEAACELLLQRDGQGLKGFQHKMVSMILYFLMEAELITPFPYPPPIDFHLARVGFATGMIDRTDQRDEDDHRLAYVDKDYLALGEALRALYFNYAQRHGIEGNRLTDALWVLSRAMCRVNPGNRTSQGKYQARRTIVEQYQPTWNKNSDNAAFSRSCQVCPVRAECTRNIPSGPRYRKGELVFSLRTEPPQEVMPFDLDEILKTPERFAKTKKDLMEELFVEELELVFSSMLLKEPAESSAS